MMNMMRLLAIGLTIVTGFAFSEQSIAGALRARISRNHPVTRATVEYPTAETNRALQALRKEFGISDVFGTPKPPEAPLLGIFKTPESQVSYGDRKLLDSGTNSQRSILSPLRQRSTLSRQPVPLSVLSEPEGTVRIMNEADQDLSFLIKPETGRWGWFTIGAGRSMTISCDGCTFSMGKQDKFIRYSLAPRKEYRLRWDEDQDFWNLYSND